MSTSTSPPRMLGDLVAAAERVRGYVDTRVRDPADAADIAQESLTRMMERARETDILRPDFYAMTIARNLVNDRFRQAAREAPAALDAADELPCEQPLADQILCERERLAVFRRTLADMPPLRREVFVRRKLAGESREAIAAALGLEVEAVKKHVSRALAQLAAALAAAEQVDTDPADHA